VIVLLLALSGEALGQFALDIGVSRVARYVVDFPGIEPGVVEFLARAPVIPLQDRRGTRVQRVGRQESFFKMDRARNSFPSRCRGTGCAMCVRGF
jgi:hypothetical protein